jgi:protein-S-isoprenylcysteine O-methyltransferase Ste14
MISVLVLVFFMLLLLLILTVVIRSIIQKQVIIGRPPISVFFFVLAKILVLVNLSFLLLRGLKIEIPVIFPTSIATDLIGLLFLITGTVFLYLSAISLQKDLIFGLSSASDHQLQTKGIYSISRHPFYLGFLFVLFSSCLFIPNLLNIAAFAGTWLIHHFIMIREEEDLVSRYGETYRQYMQEIKRYITIK